MRFEYTILDKTGSEQKGTIDTVNKDTAIATLQRNGYIITAIQEESKGGVFGGNLALFEHVSNKEIVILSRQIATLFGAQVSALRVFKLLGTDHPNALVQRSFLQIADDIQGGMSLSKAMAKHGSIFSPFYTNMVYAGEETGRLQETFEHLADYLDRTYAVTSKAQHALVYPSFIIATFVAVMVLMLTFVIPKLVDIIEDSGVAIPVYTQAVIFLSDIFRYYGVFLLLGIGAGVFGVWQWAKTIGGREYIDLLKITVPGIRSLYQKLYLTRIAENLSTMLGSGISMVQALEICSSVVENVHYERALLAMRDSLKNGMAISKAFAEHEEIPQIMVQMMEVGEETGELGNILKTLSKFYEREVEQSVDTLVGMIEPIMIIGLAGGVGTLLASVLMPIYSISTSL
jgi:type IV pilus assembly protein PilC